MNGHHRQQQGSSHLLALAAVMAATLGLAAAWWVAQPPAGLGQFERLGGEIGCTCGSCPLRPIATCGCGFADSMLADLRQMVDEGNDDETIMVAFVDQYGEMIRIAPQSSGFDLAVWAAPMLFLTLGAVAMAAIIVRWVGRAGDGQPQESATPVSAAAADVAEPDTEVSRLRAQVDAELADLEG